VTVEIRVISHYQRYHYLITAGQQGLRKSKSMSNAHQIIVWSILNRILGLAFI